MDLSGPRRNLVTRGVDLNALVGKRFYVGECELAGIELCEPCAIWAKNIHKEVVRFFVHRGGLNARIVVGAP
jgi:MOSC domain-containing protein YiiM